LPELVDCAQVFIESSEIAFCPGNFRDDVNDQAITVRDGLAFETINTVFPLEIFRDRFKSRGRSPGTLNDRVDQKSTQ
jgi:hypothetical protein